MEEIVIIPFISNLLNLSVTKYEVLKRAKKYKNDGLCTALRKALNDYNINYNILSYIFPLFNILESSKFGITRSSGYWHHTNDWSKCEKFLNWLIEQYKDDNEDLRKLKL